MRNLKREDFQVLEQGSPRRILEFSANADGPISLAVLFDTSGSMGISSNLVKGQDVVSRLVNDLRPIDEMGFFTFHRFLQEEVPFTSNRLHLRAALAEVRPWGVTSLYDAVAESARRLAVRSTSRRASSSAMVSTPAVL